MQYYIGFCNLKQLKKYNDSTTIAYLLKLENVCNTLFISLFRKKDLICIRIEMKYLAKIKNLYRKCVLVIW